MKLTGPLQNLLRSYKEQLSADEYSSFEREVWRLLDHYFAVLNEYGPGALRAQKVHALIEEQVQGAAHIKVSCQKGCSACCHLEVDITQDDAALLAQSVLDLKLEFDEIALAEQASRARQDDAWKKGMVLANRCVMLGADGACRNYENRPTVCRKHSVVTPMEDCHTLGAQPTARLIPMNEIILSAAINLPQNSFGSYAKILNKELTRLREVEHMRSLTFAEEAFSEAENSSPRLEMKP